MSVVLSEKFDRALQYASIIHAGQTRRTSEAPFLAHLLGVASLVLEYGGDEDEAIGALLHDAVEEAGGPGRLTDIRSRFGEEVANIVEGCTDSQAEPRPPWRALKAASVARIPHASPSVRLVSAADKLYNARVVLKDLRRIGNAVWERTQGSKEGMLWYYRCLVQAYKAGGTNPLVEEFERTVGELELAVARAEIQK